MPVQLRESDLDHTQLRITDRHIKPKLKAYMVSVSVCCPYEGMAFISASSFRITNISYFAAEPLKKQKRRSFQVLRHVPIWRCSRLT